jgi:hypothetical protein
MTTVISAYNCYLVTTASMYNNKLVAAVLVYNNKLAATLSVYCQALLIFFVVRLLSIFFLSSSCLLSFLD